MADARRTHVEKVWRHGQSGRHPHAMRTRGGLKGHKADTWLMRGGHMADTCRQSLEVRPINPTRTQGRHKAEKRRTQGGHGGQTAKSRPERNQSGHKADTRRIHGGQAPGIRREHIAAERMPQ